MNRDFCLDCPNDIAPPCIISKVPSGYNYDNLFSNANIYSFVDMFTCPVDSQLFKNGHMTITDNCINCGLCLNRCIYTKQTPAYFEISDQKKLLSSISHVQLYLKTLAPNYDFYNEVKTDGHSRSKRIDILAVSKNKIIMIKIMTESKKISYYRRSYESIIEAYKFRLKNIQVQCVFLVPSSLLSDYLKQSNTDTMRAVDISGLLKELKEK